MLIIEWMYNFNSIINAESRLKWYRIPSKALWQGFANQEASKDYIEDWLERCIEEQGQKPTLRAM